MYIPKLINLSFLPIGELSLFALHGRLGTGKKVIKQTDFNRIADREGFIESESRADRGIFRSRATGEL